MGVAVLMQGHMGTDQHVWSYLMVSQHFATATQQAGQTTTQRTLIDWQGLTFLLVSHILHARTAHQQATQLFKRH